MQLSFGQADDTTITIYVKNYEQDTFQNKSLRYQRMFHEDTMHVNFYKDTFMLYFKVVAFVKKYKGTPYLCFYWPLTFESPQQGGDAYVFKYVSGDVDVVYSE
jgi:hypothetical protein